ncbi:MAG: PepSY domain-containing protein [Hyphomonadaceae bacterium]
MTIRPLLFALAAFAAAAAGFGADTAHAQRFEPNWANPHSQGPGQGQGFQGRGERGRIMPVREIIAAVRAQMGPGDVIGSPILDDGGERAIYIVRWRRPNGDVIDVRVNAHNGRILGRG